MRRLVAFIALVLAVYAQPAHAERRPTKKTHKKSHKTDKAAEDKAAAEERAAEDRAAAEQAAKERAADEKAAEEKAAAEKVIEDRAAADRAARDKAEGRTPKRSDGDSDEDTSDKPDKSDRADKPDDNAGASAHDATDDAADAKAASKPVPAPMPDDYIVLDAGFWLNYTYNLFDKTDRDKKGDFGPGNSMFRVGFTTRVKGIIGSVRLRWYSYARVWEYGWVGYRWAGGNQLEVGLTKVPFGVLPYASYDYWFDIPYYLGLNNQYDVGAKWSGSFADDLIDLQTGFFKNTDIAAADDLARFSYDVVRVAGEPAAQNETTNQAAARLAIKTPIVEGGLSFKAGQLYNYDTRKRGRQGAAAVHLTANVANLSLQLQAMQYLYEPQNAPTALADAVYVGAFADAYPIAKSGQVLEANISYNFEIGHVVDSIRCYDNFSMLNKQDETLKSSKMNVAGCSVLAGPIFGFVDLISAQNAPYIGVPTAYAFTTGEDNPRWHSMFNVNLGFYFKTSPLAPGH